MKQQCVLCHSPAEYSELDGGNAKLFYCTECSEYCVTVAAEVKLGDMPQEWLEECSKLTREAGDLMLLEISVPERRENPGSTYESLRAEVVPRDQITRG